jgi:hypothetical protein
VSITPEQAKAVRSSVWYDNDDSTDDRTNHPMPAYVAVKLALHYDSPDAPAFLALSNQRMKWEMSAVAEVDLWRLTTSISTRAAAQVVGASAELKYDNMTVGDYAELVRRFPAALNIEHARKNSLKYGDISHLDTFEIAHNWLRARVKEICGDEWLVWVYIYNVARTDARDPEVMSTIEWCKAVMSWGLSLEDVAPYLQAGILHPDLIAAGVADRIDADLLHAVSQ